MAPRVGGKRDRGGGTGRGGADLEAKVLEDDLLDVAADGGRGGDGLAEVELVERGGLPRVVEPHDDELVLPRREHEEPHARHPRAHPFTGEGPNLNLPRAPAVGAWIWGIGRSASDSISWRRRRRAESPVKETRMRRKKEGIESSPAGRGRSGWLAGWMDIRALFVPRRKFLPLLGEGRKRVLGRDTTDARGRIKVRPLRPCSVGEIKSFWLL